MFPVFVRVRLPTGDYLSESISCNAEHPPVLSDVLEMYSKKFHDLYPSPNGEIHGYLKLFAKDVDEYIDVDRAIYSLTEVNPKNKLELWFSHFKQHPNAVLLQVAPPIGKPTISSKPQINTKIFKNHDFMLEKHVLLKADRQTTIEELVKQLCVEHSVLENSIMPPRTMFGWVLKETSDDKADEVDFRGKVEEDSTYQIHFVEFDFFIKREISMYFELSYDINGDLRCVFKQRENSHSEQLADRLSVGCNDLKEKPTVSLKFGVNLKVFKDGTFHETVLLHPNAPNSFKSLLEELNQQLQIFAHCQLFPTHLCCWILQEMSEYEKIEVDLDGEVEDGATYQAHFTDSHYLIEGKIRAYFKITCDLNGHLEFRILENAFCRSRLRNGTRSHEASVEKNQCKSNGSNHPQKRQVFLTLFKDGHFEPRDTVSIDLQDARCSFEALIGQLNRKHKLLRDWWQETNVSILKEVDKNNCAGVDLAGDVEEGATYQVHITDNRRSLKGEILAYFEVSSDRTGVLKFRLINRRGNDEKNHQDSGYPGATSRSSYAQVLQKNNVPEPIPVLHSEPAKSNFDQPKQVLLQSDTVTSTVKTFHRELTPPEPRKLPAILQNVTLPTNSNGNSPKAITLVLLGETGVGKSTLINGIVNYIAYSNLAEAEANEPKHLIPAKFLYDGQEIHIGEASANENIQFDGESATQRPKVYEFTENAQLYRIIDVPGIGDSRGVEQDRKNFDGILAEINRHAEINAFCILIPPNGSRITVAMRYCIYELLSNLHKDAAKNIVFCFTKARSTFYKGGETLPLLRSYLETLRKQQDVEIALREDANMFYFDNEPFKYLWLKANGVDLRNERKNYDKSFEVSRTSTLNLFSYVCGLQPHDTTAMKALTETRRLILNMVPISAAASKKIRMNKNALEGELEKLRCSRSQQKSLEEHLHFDEYVIDSAPLEHPRTVCASQRCISQIPIGNSGQFNVLYEQICHDKCALETITPGQYPNEALRSCAAFGKTDECQECGCSWDRHLHIDHLQKVRVQKAVNRELQMTLADKDIEHLTLADVIHSYEVQLRQLEEDERLIKKMSAKFSTFLRNNSMSIRNDVYADYLKHTLKLAEQELAVGGSYERVAELTQSLRAYEQEVEFLQKAERSSGPVTIDDIFELKNELRDLAERHGEIGDLLSIAEGGDTNTVEPSEPVKKAKKVKTARIEGVKTYNKEMLKDF